MSDVVLCCTQAKIPSTLNAASDIVLHMGQINGNAQSYFIEDNTCIWKGRSCRVILFGTTLCGITAGILGVVKNIPSLSIPGAIVTGLSLVQCWRIL